MLERIGKRPLLDVDQPGQLLQVERPLDRVRHPLQDGQHPPGHLLAARDADRGDVGRDTPGR